MSARLLAFAVLSLLSALPALAQEREIPMAERGYMGIQPVEINDEVRQHFKIDKSIATGLVLSQVFDGTAAAKAGLRAGDVITKIDNKPVKSLHDLMSTLATKRPGAKLAYVARRGTGTIAGLLVLGKRPQQREVIVEEEEIVEETPIAEPKPQRKEADLDRRMDRLSKDIEVLRKRALKRKARAGIAVARAGKGHSMEQWIQRERRALEVATDKRNQRGVAWHKARLSLLKEMAAAGGDPYADVIRSINERPGGKSARRGQAENRMAHLEKRLIDMLERIERLEVQLKRDRKQR